MTAQGPYTPDMAAKTYLKGPYFYFTPTPEFEPAKWWAFRKPSPSGYFDYTSPQGGALVGRV